MSEGPCPVGLSGTRLQLVTPSIQDPAREITTVTSTDGGHFLFAVPDGGFDLVVQGTDSVVIYAGLSPALDFARVELPVRGAPRVASATFPVRLETSAAACMNVSGLASQLSLPGWPEVQVAADGGVLIATASRCAEDTTGNWVVDFFDPDVGDACEVRYASWMSSGTANALQFPAPSTIPELVLTGRNRGLAAGQHRVIAPDGGDLSVRVVTRYGTRSLSVNPDGTFEPPALVTLEASSASQQGLVTRTFPSQANEVALPDFALPLAPQMNQPLAAGTRFEWTRTLDAPQMFVLEPVGGSGRLVVFTDSTSFVLPDLRPFNVSFPSGSRWEWSVFTTTLTGATTVAGLLNPGLPRPQEHADTLIGGRALSVP